MTFPERAFGSIADFFDAYADQLARAVASVSREKLAVAEQVLTDCVLRDSHIFSCGNGGSAAIANHLVCDHSRGVSADTGLRPRVTSLSANVEILSAIANDVNYSEVFVGQLRLFARPGDVLITISSSGDSENVSKAVDWAKTNGMSTIALTGFTGGRTAQNADVNLHVDAHNYGIVEDVHQTVMHALAQSLRMAQMPAEMIFSRKF